MNEVPIKPDRCGCTDPETTVLVITGCAKTPDTSDYRANEINLPVKDPIDQALVRHESRYSSLLEGRPDLVKCPEYDLINGVESFIRNISGKNHEILRYMLAYQILENIAHSSSVPDYKRISAEFMEDMHVALSEAVIPPRPVPCRGDFNAR